MPHFPIPMSVPRSCPGGKATWAWSWKFTFIQRQDWDWVELYMNLPPIPRMHSMLEANSHFTTRNTFAALKRKRCCQLWAKKRVGNMQRVLQTWFITGDAVVEVYLWYPIYCIECRCHSFESSEIKSCKMTWVEITIVTNFKVNLLCILVFPNQDSAKYLQRRFEKSSNKESKILL
jgi:hypothetical protein